jgi:hypothetical protein
MMKKDFLNKVLLYIFSVFSLIVIIDGVSFIISQMVNIKYFFDDCLPNSNNNALPICEKDFFLELIFYAKILILYAVCGLILAICCIRNK